MNIQLEARGTNHSPNTMRPQDSLSAKAAASGPEVVPQIQPIDVDVSEHQSPSCPTPDIGLIRPEGSSLARDDSSMPSPTNNRSRRRYAEHRV